MSFPPQLIQTKASPASSSNSQNATWNSNTTNGNLIVVAVFTSFSAFSVVSSITDSQSNVYTKIDSGVSGNTDAELWYSPSIKGGTTPTITVSFTGSQDCGFIAREYGFISTTSPKDKNLIGTSSSTPASSGATAVTSQSVELVVGWGVATTAAPSLVAGAGYGNLTTLTGAGNTVAFEDKTVTETAAQTATFSFAIGANMIAGVATFRAVSTTFRATNALKPYPFQPGIAR